MDDTLLVTRALYAGDCFSRYTMSYNEHRSFKGPFLPYFIYSSSLLVVHTTKARFRVSVFCTCHTWHPILQCSVLVGFKGCRQFPELVPKNSSSYPMSSSTCMQACEKRRKWALANPSMGCKNACRSASQPTSPSLDSRPSGMCTTDWITSVSSAVHVESLVPHYYIKQLHGMICWS